MTAAALYTQIVLEHQRAPRNFGVLETHSHAADGANPLCGDTLRIELLCRDRRIERMHFHGEACAIAVAAASMLSELAVGKSLADVVQMEATFARLVDGSLAHEASLADLNAMQALCRYPTRRKCALLAFATLRAALAGTASATTEGELMDAVAAAPVVAFRDATPVDVAAIIVLVESAYRGDASRAGWTTEADMLDGQRVDAVGVSDIVTKPGSRLLLAEADSALLACCHLERQGDICYFGMFSVKPTQQGGGLGKRMLAEAERLAREEWRSTRVEMTVISIRDELIAWYERRGYRRTGRYTPFPYGDERFGIPKRDDLRFELLEKRLA